MLVTNHHYGLHHSAKLALGLSTTRDIQQTWRIQ
uniref:Uncharacterized protein n=1 Tax=Anguilla anguilla TaxID=7936 RepID=A0A0E9RDY2_ANGAN